MNPARHRRLEDIKTRVANGVFVRPDDARFLFDLLDIYDAQVEALIAEARDMEGDLRRAESELLSTERELRWATQEYT